MSIQIDFPYAVGPRGRTATTTYPDHVRDMIEQLIFTVPGERVELPEFGCGLADLVFETNSPAQADAIQAMVEGALARWLGDVIEVESVTATAQDSTLDIAISYRLIATGEQQTATIVREVPT
jgi:uncharacterized protein